MLFSKINSLLKKKIKKICHIKQNKTKINQTTTTKHSKCKKIIYMYGALVHHAVLCLSARNSFSVDETYSCVYIMSLILQWVFEKHF